MNPWIIYSTAIRSKTPIQNHLETKQAAFLMNESLIESFSQQIHSKTYSLGNEIGGCLYEQIFCINHTT